MKILSPHRREKCYNQATYPVKNSKTAGLSCPPIQTKGTQSRIPSKEEIYGTGK